MNFSDVQANFLSILNRRDCTPSQVLTFLSFAIQRIQRELRVPAMERQVVHTFDGTETPVGALPLPNDFLETISVSTNDSVEQNKLKRVDLQTASRLAQGVGYPKVYYRQNGFLILGPRPLSGISVYLDYYQDAATLTNPTDTNWITIDAPDLLVYGALTYAADFFLDERADKWEARFQSIVVDLQNMADQDELENAVIMPAYETEFAPYYPYC